MFSVGILVFLLVDVLGHAFEISEHAVEAYKEETGSFGSAVGYAALLIGGFALGSAGLGIFERRMRNRAPAAPIAGGATDVLAVEDAHRLMIEQDHAAKRALHTGLIVAAAIGVHNFAEGLAIGVPPNPARSASPPY